MESECNIVLNVSATDNSSLRSLRAERSVRRKVSRRKRRFFNLQNDWRRGKSKRREKTLKFGTSEPKPPRSFDLRQLSSHSSRLTLKKDTASEFCDGLSEIDSQELTAASSSQSLLSQEDQPSSRLKHRTTVDRNWYSFLHGKADDLQVAHASSIHTSSPSPSSTIVTKAIALDCEMVGVGEGGSDNALARVSMVNSQGICIYDKYVQPRENVTDYRTEVSGITPYLLETKGVQFSVVQKEVSDLLNGRVLVGHALVNDLKALFLSHPKKRIRDTSKYKPLRRAIGHSGTPSLRKLSEGILLVDIQSAEHSSVEDARAAMTIYLLYKKQWEREVAGKHLFKRKKC